MKLFVGHILDEDARKRMLEYTSLDESEDEDFGFAVCVIAESESQAVEKVRTKWGCDPYGSNGMGLDESPDGTAATGILGDEWALTYQD